MGKVFSWDEIASGKVPELPAFNKIAEIMKREINTNPGILGGLLFGSFLWGCHNRRSDLDFLVVYEPTARDQVMDRLRQIKIKAWDLSVPLALITIDRRLASSPYHSINPLFAKHFEVIVRNNGVIKANPLEYFHFDSFDNRIHFQNYMKFKLRFLGNDLVAFETMSVSALHRYLQKMLEAPVHIARKILNLHGCQLENDSSGQVIEKYLDILGQDEAGLPQLFRELIGRDFQYNADLIDQLINPNEQKYKKTIADLKSAAEYFYKYVRQVALSFDS